MDPFSIKGLNQFFLEHQAWLESRIGVYVDTESPSENSSRLDEFAEVLEKDLLSVGAQLNECQDSPRLVVARFSSSGQPSTALVFHHDTVWPVGSFPNPRREAANWYGPGIFDMKANLPLVMLSLIYLKKFSPGILKKIIWVSSPDEEILGPVSTHQIPVVVAGCERALVFEPPQSHGQLKQQRKGVARLVAHFLGRSSHAGNHYQSGLSALKAAAKFLLFSEGLSALDMGLTINVGRLTGGTSVNTRPGSAVMDLDIRFRRKEHWETVLQQLKAYSDPDKVKIKLDIRSYLPPMDANHEDWEHLRGACDASGCCFALGSAGGGSDGSRLAEMGIKVMDGLGVIGDGEHADHEHIQIAALKPYFVRNTLLVKKLLADGSTAT